MSTRLEQLKAMLAQEPEDEFLQYAIAMEYMSGGEFRHAADTLRKLLVTNENYLAAYYQLGKCYEAEDETSDALIIYRKGVAVAESQKNTKTANELKEAIFLLED